eukprot:gnl/MRDRNA2_/MRDRNA2_114938_c0_seq1.p1 gnl/MRDRNA2_/MRDRNA2_114938_c0~~gnl/MRDRNA2_/MRDRNA2_114938_c0_seq1.p1  ORF type:complete len:478 (+),score=138.30 gnl/MRDRNA2_/MRDRNA2_114938_c0_seq1:120-1436(+)
MTASHLRSRANVPTFHRRVRGWRTSWHKFGAQTASLVHGTRLSQHGDWRDALAGVRRAAASSEDNPAEVLDEPAKAAIMLEIKAMRAKDIKAELQNRRIPTDGLFDKEALVERLFEARIGTVTPAPERETGGSDGVSINGAVSGDDATAQDKAVQDTLDSLKGIPGMENFQVFTPDDLKGMSTDEIAKQVGVPDDVVSKPQTDSGSSEAVGASSPKSNDTQATDQTKTIYDAVDSLKGMPGMENLKVLDPQELGGMSAGEIAEQMGVQAFGTPLTPSPSEEAASMDATVTNAQTGDQIGDQGQPLSEQATRFQEMMQETAAKARAEGNEAAAKAAEDTAKLALQLGDEACADIYEEAFGRADAEKAFSKPDAVKPAAVVQPPAEVSLEEIRAMRVADIKTELNERRIKSDDCFEKEDLVKRLYNARTGAITPAPSLDS